MHTALHCAILSQDQRPKKLPPTSFKVISPFVSSHNEGQRKFRATHTAQHRTHAQFVDLIFRWQFCVYTITWLAGPPRLARLPMPRPCLDFAGYKIVNLPSNYPLYNYFLIGKLISKLPPIF